MKHLTDSQIQQFAFDQSEPDYESKAHIQQCAACRNKMEEYRLLFAEVEKLPEASFDMGLEAIIMAQLPQASTSKKEDKALWYALALVCFLSVLSLIYFFGKDLTVLFGGVKLLISALIITTAFCLLVFLAVDMYRTYQTKMKALNFE